LSVPLSGTRSAYFVQAVEKNWIEVSFYNFIYYYYIIVCIDLMRYHNCVKLFMYVYTYYIIYYNSIVKLYTYYRLCECPNGGDFMTIIKYNRVVQSSGRGHAGIWADQTIFFFVLLVSSSDHYLFASCGYNIVLLTYLITVHTRLWKIQTSR